MRLGVGTGTGLGWKSLLIFMGCHGHGARSASEGQKDSVWDKEMPCLCCAPVRAVHPHTARCPLVKTMLFGGAGDCAASLPDIS